MPLPEVYSRRPERVEGKEQLQLASMQTLLRFSAGLFPTLLNHAFIRKIGFSNLLRSTISLLITLDIHPKIVQELLGHSNIIITMAIYSDSAPNPQEEAVSKLEALLAK